MSQKKLNKSAPPPQLASGGGGRRSRQAARRQRAKRGDLGTIITTPAHPAPEEGQGVITVGRKERVTVHSLRRVALKWTQGTGGQLDKTARACERAHEQLDVCGNAGGKKVWAVTRDGVPGLAGTLYCSCRVCPVCTKMRISINKGKGMRVTDKFLRANDKHCLLMVTLTVPRAMVESFTQPNDIDAMLTSERLARSTWARFAKIFPRMLKKWGVKGVMRTTERQLSFGRYYKGKRVSLGSHLHFHSLALCDGSSVSPDNSDPLILAQLVWAKWNDILVRIVTEERKRDKDIAPWVDLSGTHPTPVMPPKMVDGEVKGGVNIKWISRQDAASVVSYLADPVDSAGISGELALGANKVGRGSVAWLGALKLDSGPNWALAKDAFRYAVLASRGERTFEFSRVKDESSGKRKSLAVLYGGEDEGVEPVIEVEAVALAGDYYKSRARGAEYEDEMSLRKHSVAPAFGGVVGFSDTDITPAAMDQQLKKDALKRALGRAKHLALRKGSQSVWTQAMMKLQGYELQQQEGRGPEWVYVGDGAEKDMGSV